MIKKTYLHSTPLADVDTDWYHTKSTDIRSDGRSKGKWSGRRFVLLYAVFGRYRLGIGRTNLAHRNG